MAVHEKTNHCIFGWSLGTHTWLWLPPVSGFAQFAWVPKRRDKDGDGLADKDDRCPTVAGPRGKIVAHVAPNASQANPQ